MPAPQHSPPLVPRSMRVGEEQVRAYAELSGDFNPLHLDEEFARATPHGARIAHGTLSLNLLWQSIAATYGAEAIGGCTLEARFVKPVYLDDIITTRSANAEDADGTLAVSVQNQHGETVINGRLRLASG